ncbi:hypothetical protein RI054_29g117250 [Pseudoscourfieldia marina]
MPLACTENAVHASAVRQAASNGRKRRVIDVDDLEDDDADVLAEHADDPCHVPDGTENGKKRRKVEKRTSAADRLVAALAQKYENENAAPPPPAAAPPVNELAAALAQALTSVLAFCRRWFAPSSKTKSKRDCLLTIATSTTSTIYLLQYCYNTSTIVTKPNICTIHCYIQ